MVRSSASELREGLGEGGLAVACACNDRGPAVRGQTWGAGVQGRVQKGPRAASGHQGTWGKRLGNEEAVPA